MTFLANCILIQLSIILSTYSVNSISNTRCNFPATHHSWYLYSCCTQTDKQWYNRILCGVISENNILNEYQFKKLKRISGAVTSNVRCELHCG